MSELERFFAEARQNADALLETLLPAAEAEPRSLHEAMRWSIFGGGKRFRPALLVAAGMALGAPAKMLQRSASAVEMIHTYSLIHDDLPAMDDDDLRRGKATCHRKFGEATAILAGDALQVLAFRTIADDEKLDAGVRLDLIRELSVAAGDMVDGQQLDLDAEGKQISIEEIKRIHDGKTGALIAFSARAGGLIAGASQEKLAAMTEFGKQLGLLFQITDDLLDVTQTSETLGKTAGKDAASNKATYISVLGLEAATTAAGDIRQTAWQALSPLGESAYLLKAICAYVADRTN